MSRNSRIPAAAAEASTLPVDEIFGLLEDQCRRRFLYHLFTSDGAVDLDEVVGRLAAEIDDGDRDRTRIAIELHHNHLPKLVARDVAVYDETNGTVELTDRGAGLEPFLTLAETYERA